MSDLTQEISEPIKGIKDEHAAQYDDKIKALDQKADARWDALKAKPDAVLGESLKSILADAEKARAEKAAALESALTKRMDEVEAKARGASAEADPHEAMLK